MQNNKIAAAYNSWSQIYETNENPTRDLAAKSLREKSLNLQNADVLEIGCGTGVNTRYLAEHSRSVTGIDFSEGMLAQARVNVASSNVQFVQNDIQLNWTIEDNSIDFIVCTLVLEHIENLRHVFDEARRALRPHGDFLIYELHPFRQLKGGQAQFQDVESAETVFVPVYLHSVSEFVNTALDAGFELLRLDELRDANDEAEDALPRLLSIHIRKK